MNTLTGLSPEYTERLKERFWAKVDINKGKDDCWEWTAGKDSCGYGRIRVIRMQNANRISYLLDQGAIPLRFYVCHRCDNPPCVNPKHLWLGTQKQNVADMICKGRYREISALKGEDLPQAKLTEIMVQEIVSLSRKGFSLPELAAKFNVKTIFKIVNGLSWCHVTAIVSFGLKGKVCGIKSPKAKLIEAQVLQIASFEDKGKINYSQIGRDFNISPAQVKNILTGKRWSHLTGIVYIAKKS